MTREEFTRIAKAIKTSYPRFEVFPSAEAVMLWHRELEDIDYRVAEVAVRQWIESEKWPPTIADIREKAAKVASAEPEEDWATAWMHVREAIRNFGVWNISGALDSLHGIARETVERIGFEEICMEENPDIMRAHFQRVYETLQRRHDSEAQLSPGLKVDMKRLADELFGGHRALDKGEEDDEFEEKRRAI